MASINSAISIVTGIAVLTVLFMVVPMIGENVDDAWTPGTTSQWNVTVNTDLTTGSAFWTDMGAMVGIGVLVLIVGAIILKPLIGLQG